MAYQATGIFGQKIHINPDLDLVVVIQSAWPTASNGRNSAAMSAYLKAVEEAVAATPK